MNSESSKEDRLNESVDIADSARTITRIINSTSRRRSPFIFVRKGLSRVITDSVPDPLFSDVRNLQGEEAEPHRKPTQIATVTDLVMFVVALMLVLIILGNNILFARSGSPLSNTSREHFRKQAASSTGSTITKAATPLLMLQVVEGVKSSPVAPR